MPVVWLYIRAASQVELDRTTFGNSKKIVDILEIRLFLGLVPEFATNRLPETSKDNPLGTNIPFVAHVSLFIPFHWLSIDILDIVFASLLAT